MSLAEISTHIQSLANDASKKLSEETALEYTKKLKQAIMQTRDLTSIITLTKMLDYTPKSDIIFGEFDSALMAKLLKIAYDAAIPANITRSILRIWLTYLAGVLPVTRTRGMFNPLLKTMCGKPSTSFKLMRKLTPLLRSADARMNLNIVDFVSKVLYRIIESNTNLEPSTSSAYCEEENQMVTFLRGLYCSDFFGVLCSIDGIDEVQSMTGLSNSMEIVKKWMDDKTVSFDSPYWLEAVQLCDDVGIRLKHYPNCKLLHVLVVIGCLLSPKKALKTFVECSMEEPFPLLSFVNRLSLSLPNSAVYRSIFSVWNVSLWYSLLNVVARCWLISGAQAGEPDDEDAVARKGDVAIHWLSDQLSLLNNSYENIALLFDDVSDFKYEDLKRVQLDALFEQNMTKLNGGTNGDRLTTFKTMMKEQVHSFVKNERFLELSKGCWVYSANPLLMASQYTGTWYYVTLSSDAESIVYKEFPQKLGSSKYPEIASVTNSPKNIDKDCIKIDLKDVVRVTSENLCNDNTADTGLITMTSQRMLVNKVDIVSQNATLTFFINTVQLKEVWVDGLSMLLNSGNKGYIDENILNQMKQLKSIAMRTQLLSLDDESFVEIYKRQKESVEYDVSKLNTNYVFQ